MKRTIALALSAALLLASAPSVDGATWSTRDVRGGSTTYALGQDRDGDGVLSWNDVVHVTATPPDGAFLWGTVGVACYYGFVSERKPGTLVYSATWIYESSNPIVHDYVLDSIAWVDNTAATCAVSGYWVDGTRQYTYGRQWFPVAA